MVLSPAALLPPAVWDSVVPDVSDVMMVISQDDHLPGFSLRSCLGFLGRKLSTSAHLGGTIVYTLGADLHVAS